ncbi:MAG: helicase C-terminal domain-containing protein, partial [Caldanaerobacter sp.]
PVAKKYKILEALRVTKTTQAIIDDVLSNSKYKKFKKEVRSQQHNSHVAIFFSFSDRYKCPSIASLNPVPNGATRYIAEVYNSVVAMSGTLTSSTGSFDTIAKRLGIYDKMPITDVFKGFNLKRMVKLHLYPDNPEPYDENVDLSSYIEANKENINRIIQYARGRVLILCPAYKDVDMWREVIQTNRTTIIQEKGSGISSFKGSIPEDCVIIAVNAWEGVDIDGLSDVVITRIPNVHPDDIMYIAVEAVYESFFQSRAKKANVFAIVSSQKKYDAFIRTRQGMGRLVRKETDNGNIHIFDPRALQWEEWFVDHYTVVKHKALKTHVPAMV